MKKNTSTFVLDTYAIFCYLNKEKGYNYVVKLLKKAECDQITVYFSTINLGELYYILIREIGETDATQLLQQIQSLPIQFVETDKSLILQAAKIKAVGGLSYADAFAIAVAQFKQATLVTGDKEFKQFSKLVTIDWI